MKAHHERLAFAGALAALFLDIDLLLIPTQPRANFTLVEEKEISETRLPPRMKSEAGFSGSMLKGRMTPVPIGRLLIGMAGLHQQLFIEMPARQLKREWQASCGEAARQGDRRAAGHVERRGEAEKSGEAFWGRKQKDHAQTKT